MIFFGTNFVVFQSKDMDFLWEKCEHFSSANLTIFLVMGKKLANSYFFGVSNFFEKKQTLKAIEICHINNFTKCKIWV
jgi:hypothetical protein